MNSQYEGTTELMPSEVTPESKDSVSLVQRKISSRIIVIFCILLYCIGVISPAFYETFSHKTYYSENALLPGSASFEFTVSSKFSPSSFTKKFSEFKREGQKEKDVCDWILDQMRSYEAGGALVEVYKQEYLASISNTNLSMTTACNAYIILRAPKSPGTECILLTGKFNNERAEISETSYEISDLGLSLSLLKHFQSRKWLAKDILFVVTDSRFGNQGINHWLAAYFGDDSEGNFQGNQILNEGTDNAFPRGGVIEAAINVDLPPSKGFSQLEILIEGSNGQLPNLDLFNTVYKLSRLIGLNERQLSLSAKRNTDAVIPWLIAKYAPAKLSTLLSFMLYQAVGVPTGDHGSFNRYHVESLTITSSEGEVSNEFIVHTVQLGRIIEGTVRALNNLLERLHQSYYYYILTGPENFISIAEYMISLGLLFFGFAGNIIIKITSLKYEIPMVYSVCLVLAFHLVGLLAFIFPFIIDSMFPGLPAEPMVLIWMGFIIAVTTSLFRFFLPKMDAYFTSIMRETTTKKEVLLDAISFKVIASMPLLVFLGCGSLLNFSFCFFVAIPIVPLYGMLFPTTDRFLWWMEMILLTLFSPAGLVLLCSRLVNISVAQLLWTIFEQYCLFGNLTFPFLALVYLPVNLEFFLLMSTPPTKSQTSITE